MRFVAVIAALVFTGTAAAQWTPTRPGDPRTCGGTHTPIECGSAAASAAFKAKYARITGHPFYVNLRCTSAGGTLTYLCVWGSPHGDQQTLVRFAHKAAGWKVAVGVIAP